MSDNVITTLKTRAVIGIVSVVLAFCACVVSFAYALNYILNQLGFTC